MPSTLAFGQRLDDPHRALTAGRIDRRQFMACAIGANLFEFVPSREHRLMPVNLSTVTIKPLRDQFWIFADRNRLA